MTALPIERIRRDPRTQPRNHIDHATVERYRDALADGAVLPPVTVFFDGTDYWLSDGWHRVTAMLCLDRTEIEVDVREGTLRDAEWHSFSVNAIHGYPRGPDDVKRILNRIFSDPDWSAKSLREISRHTSIPEPTVRRRYHSSVSASPTQIKPVEREVTRGGATYSMDTSGIGRREPGRNASERWSPEDIADIPRRPGSDGDEDDGDEDDGADPRRIDIEDILGDPEPPPPRDPAHAFAAFPPEHARPASRIRELVRMLHLETSLEPADAARAFPWGRADYRVEAMAVAGWLRMLADEIAIEMEEVEP